jgi:hypothetical protein
MAYKNYCNRRKAKKGQEPEESHCCPLRMPLIGPILFSLFIFSPLLLQTSEADKNPDLNSVATNEKSPLTKSQSPPNFEISDQFQDGLLPW